MFFDSSLGTKFEPVHAQAAFHTSHVLGSRFLWGVVVMLGLSVPDELRGKITRKHIWRSIMVLHVIPALALFYLGPSSLEAAVDFAFHVDVVGIGGYRLFGKVISDWMLVPSYLAATMAATRRNDKLS